MLKPLIAVAASALILGAGSADVAARHDRHGPPPPPGHGPAPAPGYGPPPPPHGHHGPPPPLGYAAAPAPGYAPAPLPPGYAMTPPAPGYAPAPSCAPVPGAGHAVPPVAAASQQGIQSTALAPELTTVQGSLYGYTYSPSGNAHGLLLDTGAEIRFPPHEAAAAYAVLTEGAAMEATGVWHVGRRGHGHLRAHTIANLDTGATVAIGAMAPFAPLPPPGPAAPIAEALAPPAAPPGAPLPPAGPELPMDGSPSASEAGPPPPEAGAPPPPAITAPQPPPVEQR